MAIVRVEKIVQNALGLLRCESGKILLVPNALPGELYDTVSQKVIESAGMRREPFCPYYNECGGCDFQIVSEEDSAYLKEQIVMDSFKRVGKQEGEISFSSPVFSSGRKYRRRVKFSVNLREREVGFLSRKTERIIPLSNCPILTKGLNDLLGEKKEILNKARKKIFEGKVRRSGLINVDAIEGEDGVSLDEKVVTASSYKVNAAVFFQANKFLLPSFLSYVKEKAEGDVIIDLFSGVGTFSRLFPDKEVYAVEKNPRCLELAKINAPNAVSVTSDVFFWLKKEKVKADTVIVDPPRGGLEERVIKALMDLKSDSIIYVSCNAVSLARDIAMMRGYEIKEAKIFDFYPGTSHTETVVLMSRSGV